MTRSSPRAVDVPPRVRIERTGAVAVLTLDDERRRNVLGLELRTRLRAALAELAADPGIGALVLLHYVRKGTGVLAEHAADPFRENEKEPVR